MGIERDTRRGESIVITITLTSVDPTTPTFEVSAYIYGTCAVHRRPLALCPLEFSHRGWRVSHVPTGAKVHDFTNLQHAQAVARELGGHPLYAKGALVLPSPKSTRRAAYDALVIALQTHGAL